MTEEPPEVDVDEATLVIMRANDKALRELQSKLVQAAGSETESELVSQALKVARRQQALISEVPGLETYAHGMARLIAQLEQY